MLQAFLPFLRLPQFRKRKRTDRNVCSTTGKNACATDKVLPRLSRDRTALRPLEEERREGRPALSACAPAPRRRGGGATVPPDRPAPRRADARDAAALPPPVRAGARAGDGPHRAGDALPPVHA